MCYLEIPGEGAMHDWSRNTLSERPWDELRTTLKKLAIGEGITRIGVRAFEGFENLEEVILPSSVRAISYHAFYDCRSLRHVRIPGDADFRFFYEPEPEQEERQADPSSARIIRLGLHAFARTPWGAEFFGEFARRGDILLEYLGQETEVTIPEDIHRIHVFAFAGLPITQVHFHDAVSEIGAFAFNRTRLSEVKLPSNIRCIDNGAFSAIDTFSRGILQKGTWRTARIHPNAFLGSAAAPPDRRPGKNHLYRLTSVPANDAGTIRELAIVPKEHFVGTERISLYREVSSLLEQDKMVVQIAYLPGHRKIFRVAALFPDRYNYMQASLNWFDDPITVFYPFNHHANVDLRRVFRNNDALRLISGQSLWCSQYFLPERPHRLFRETWYETDYENAAGPMASMMACLNFWKASHPDYTLAA